MSIYNILNREVDMNKLGEFAALGVSGSNIERYTEATAAIKRMKKLVANKIESSSWLLEYNHREKIQRVPHVEEIIKRYNDGTPKKMYNKDLDFLFMNFGGGVYTKAKAYPLNAFTLDRKDDSLPAIVDAYLNDQGIENTDRHIFLLPHTDWRFDTINNSGISNSVEIATITTKKGRGTILDKYNVHGIKICNCEEQDQYQLIVTPLGQKENDLTFSKIPRSKIVKYDIEKVISTRRWEEPIDTFEYKSASVPYY